AHDLAREIDLAHGVVLGIGQVELTSGVSETARRIERRLRPGSVRAADDGIGAGERADGAGDGVDDADDLTVGDEDVPLPVAGERPRIAEVRRRERTVDPAVAARLTGEYVETSQVRRRT